MLWEHKGDVVWVFGWHAPPTNVVTAALGILQLTVEVVSTKRFCHDLQHVAWSMLPGLAYCVKPRARVPQLQGVMVTWQGPRASNALLCLHCSMSLMMCSKHPQSHLQHVLNTGSI